MDTSISPSVLKARIRAKNWYYQHRARALEKSKIYREENSDSIKKNKRNYYLKNKDRVRLLQKKYLEKNKAKIRSWQRDYYNKRRKYYIKKAGENQKLPHRLLWKRWNNMMSRCYRFKTRGYKNYGGRGITVSAKWRVFESFKADMELSFNEHLGKFGSINTTLERIDVNKHYCLGNCKWASMREQQNNRRNSKKNLSSTESHASHR